MDLTTTTQDELRQHFQDNIRTTHVPGRALLPENQAKLELIHTALSIVADDDMDFVFSAVFLELQNLGYKFETTPYEMLKNICGGTVQDTDLSRFRSDVIEDPSTGTVYDS